PSDDTASARTEVKMSWPDTPEPNADHSLPFHWAMELTGIAYVVNRRSACGDEIASYIQGVAGRRQRFNIPGPARRAPDPRTQSRPRAPIPLSDAVDRYSACPGENAPYVH